jgi:hypothetical protein
MAFYPFMRLGKESAPSPQSSPSSRERRKRFEISLDYSAELKPILLKQPVDDSGRNMVRY